MHAHASVAATAEPRTLTRAEIEALLPHRPPMLLLDEVTVLEPGRRGRGRLVPAAGEPWFAGHFPGRPILPGVLVIEACAQLVGVTRAAAGGAPGGGVEYLAAVDRFKLLRPVRPGETLTMEAEIGREALGLLRAAVRAGTAAGPAAEGVLTITARGEG